MTATALCSDIIFAIPQYLRKRDDLLTWRGLCRIVEPQMTKRLLATRTSPITLHTVADIEAFHRMTFRGGSHKGRLAAFAGHVELSAGYIPPTHLHLVLDIFEHAQGITGLSVGDFDTTLSSFLLPGVTPESESNATTIAAHELGTPADGMREVEASLSDVLARRLLACWARNRSLTKFSIDYRLIQPARLSPVPCQWRSDAILEEERFPFVTDLSVHLGNKPTSKWHGGWRSAFPNMTHLALKIGDGDGDSGASKLGQGRGSWQTIRVDTEPRRESRTAERDLLGAEGERKGREEAEAAAQSDHGEIGGEDEGSRPQTGEIEVEEGLERKDGGDHKTRQTAYPPPRRWGRANH